MGPGTKTPVFTLFLRMLKQAFKYLTNMKRLPIVLLVFGAGTFLAFNSMGTGSKTPPGKYEKILKSVGEMLTEGHFSPKEINDDFSKKIFKEYLDALDPDKNIFLKEDVVALKKFETHIDDEIKGANVEFFLAAGKIFDQRKEEAAKIYADLLENPFEFTKDENVVMDPEKLNFAATVAERNEAWRKKVKYLVLDRYADMIDVRDKIKGKEGFTAKTDVELEKDAREKVKKALNRTFERYRFKFSDDDKFNVFVKIITNTMDPHTDFFPPVDKRYFDEQMSGQFFGIGASLAYDEGNIKINSLLTGSPAWKSGEVKTGDIILKVAQGKEEPVELTGFLVEDAVKLIRGTKGTEVKLTLKKQDGTINTISLIRDKIVQDETYARSAIVKNENSKIGYIFLPEFYADFESPNGPRCYIDVAKEIMKLKEEKVDGIVLDLRNNGGGSLYDVVQMAGLFIDEGPIVQVKDREGRPSILRDKDKNILYDGPLAVMVNEFSASASEIFAAAIQDYGRGVIIGSTTTYGKGTVQRNLGLDLVSNNGGATSGGSNSELGTVKLTLQKFYRINGGSTQLKGVSSDIVLPDNMENYKFREKDDPNALPWDEITKANYTNWNAGYSLSSIQKSSKDRLDKSLVFKLIKENSEWLAKQNDKEYSLQIDKFRKEQKMIRSTVKQLQSLLTLTDELSVNALQRDEAVLKNDKDKQDRFNNWLKTLKKDIYIDQAVKVVKDMISERLLVQNNSIKTETPKKAF
jgi:carboxyl-terminal processing protease